MDTSQHVRAQAFVPSLDEEFEVIFDPQMEHQSPEDLRQEAQWQKERLAKAREQVQGVDTPQAIAILTRIEEQQIVEQIDSLVSISEQDPDAVAQLDRRLRALAAAVDEMEDAVEWPLLLKQAEEERRDTERVVEKYGEDQDRNRLRALTAALQRAMDGGDPLVLRQATDDLTTLYFDVLDRQPGYHVGRFNWLVERKASMHDQQQADALIAKGRRDIENNDIEALKATNRQLQSLLPRGPINGGPRGGNRGDTEYRG